MQAPLVAAAGCNKRGHVAADRGAVRLRLLDSLQLTAEGTIVPLSVSVQRLLAFVALKRRPVQRHFAAGSLWPNASEHRAAASLRSTLWRLRRGGRGFWLPTAHS